jgi:hypothetical protein
LVVLSFLFVGNYYEQRKGGKAKKATSKVRDRSFESILAPFTGVPADLLVPLLKSVVDGSMTINAASIEAYNLKAEARLAARTNEELIRLGGPLSTEPQTTYEELLGVHDKKGLMLQFKSTFLSLTFPYFVSRQMASSFPSEQGHSCFFFC